MRAVFARILPFSLGLAPASSVEGADCIDYADYVHWVGGVSLPPYSTSVTLDGHIAYVVTGYSGSGTGRV